VSGATKSTIPVWLSLSLAALSLCLGCTPRQPAVDMYLDAVMLRELGQDELAVKKLNAVIAADPDFALAYAELGKAQEKLGNREKALAAFRKAAELDPWARLVRFTLSSTFSSSRSTTFTLPLTVMITVEPSCSWLAMRAVP